MIGEVVEAARSASAGRGLAPHGRLGLHLLLAAVLASHASRSADEVAALHAAFVRRERAKRAGGAVDLRETRLRTFEIAQPEQRNVHGERAARASRGRRVRGGGGRTGGGK